MVKSIKSKLGREAHAALSPDEFRGMGGFSIFSAIERAAGEEGQWAQV